MMNRSSIKNIYTGLRERNELLLAKLKKESLMISFLRLFVFLGGAGVSIYAFTILTIAGVLTLLATLFFFIILLKRYAVTSNKIAFTENLIRINTNEINALDGDYSAFDGGGDLADSNHDFSLDIDLFGDDSLFRYINRSVTGPGRSLLADWFSDPYRLSGQISERQEAVRELAGKLDWRQQFMAYGLDKLLHENEIKSLSDWLNGKDKFMSSQVMRLITFILPLAAIIALVLVITTALPAMVFITSFIVNLLIIMAYIKKVNRIHILVSQKQVFLSTIEQMVKSFEKEEFTSSMLTSIRGRIFSGEGSVAGKIKELNNLISMFDARLNMLVGFALNGMLMWDFHCISRLEKWRLSAASDLPAWLTLLGEVDGLNSLANYTYNNPYHSFPQAVNDGTILEASQMGHPLLAEELRINNDFSVRKKGQVIIITGANMAGKSTFQRTVAVNMVLAMAGAPVCAAAMKFFPMKLFTSMRTTDSLSHNESYFYAELKRLRTLKERLEKGEDVFFILDEILKGTNSTDKSLGSKLFLRRLIELGATGLIATHDISLGEMETEFPGNVVNKCFEIEIDGENISFDYILRDGITRKMNAGVLMKQMGIV
jgi:MutS domain V/MutS domain III